MRMYKYLLLLLIVVISAIPCEAEERDTIFLLHGLGRSSKSMLLLKHRLENKGFQLVSRNYESTEQSIADHVKWLEQELENCCQPDRAKVHFVTHSLGGIIVRSFLKDREYKQLGRVVMLSPPNQGSELADIAKEWKVYEIIMGPSGQELGTGPESIPKSLGPVNFELGIIMGNRSYNPVGSKILPGPDDGVVSVESAKVEGMKDFLVVNQSHSFIMNSAEVAKQVVIFLRNGLFLHEKGSERTSPNSP